MLRSDLTTIMRLPRLPRVLLLVASIFAATGTSASAQGPWHYLNKADTPPGVIGQRQLQRGGPLPGYFQPVEVTAPAGSLVSVASEGGFSEAREGSALAGMLIGQV